MGLRGVRGEGEKDGKERERERTWRQMWVTYVTRI